MQNKMENGLKLQYVNVSGEPGSTAPVAQQCANIAMWNAAPPEISYQSSGDAPFIDLKAPKYSKELADKRRNTHLTSNHTVKQKMKLYSCSTKGKLSELRELLEGTEGPDG